MKKSLAAFTALCTLASLANASGGPVASNFCNGKPLDANYQHPDSCAHYVVCDHTGQARVMDCPTGLHYTEGARPYGHCDSPHLAHCEADKNAATTPPRK